MARCSKISPEQIRATLFTACTEDWRAETAYAADCDYAFASSKLDGRKPRIESMVVEDYLQPAAIRSGVLKVKNGKRYIDGEFVKRFGFHTFRHSHTSWLIANGGNPQIVRAMPEAGLYLRLKVPE